MRSKNRSSLLMILSAMFLAASNFGCASGQSATPPNTTTAQISVSIAPLAAQSVDESQTVNFTANVSNDSANKGVTWTVSCGTAPCGTVSPTSTASGAPTTYTAPGSVSGNLSVTITATSVADSTKSAPGSVTVMALSVSVSPSTAQTVDQGQSLKFIATVANDSSNKGVTWSVSGAGCAGSACGTVSPTATASGAATTYTAPNTVAANRSVTITAASVADPTKAASAPINVPGIMVIVSPMTATLQAGAKAQFTATVTNDGGNNGVTWTISCSAAPCGSISPNSTATGAATTYSAPASPPPSPLTVTLTATSVTDGTKTASATVTVPVVTVSVTPSAATVKVGASAQFSATVGNDVASRGVNWTISCSLPTCGSVSPAATASGAITTYMAPTTQIIGSLTVTLTLTSVTDPAASASATITVAGITVSITPNSASVSSGGTQQFTATVNNDPNNGGVSWQLLAELACFPSRFPSPCYSKPQIFVACSTCGTLSPTSTASGAPVTYTAPAHFTPPRSGIYFFFRGLFIVATSVTAPAASAKARITILPISVSVSPAGASVALSAAQQFTATVTNDGANGGSGAGLTWTLTQNGTACSPGCGTIAPASTASAAPVTYTAPATVPPLPVVTLTATSVTDGTKAASATITVTTASGAACGAGSGSESLLKGQYAFMFRGADSHGFSGWAGGFTADGTGKITAGEEDADFGSGSSLSFDTTRSSYSVGSDHRGCLMLAITNGGITYFRFALGSINSGSIATKGHIIEFDDATGAGKRLAGTLRLQDATSFAASQFKGNYAVGLSGSDGNSARLAIAGTFTSDGVSAITATNFDINDAGTISSNLSSAPGGSFTCCSANGRGTLQITAGSFSFNLAFYMISSSDAFLANTSSGQSAGEAIAAPGPFSITSLNGAAVLRQTAQSSTGSIVDIATAHANGAGAITVTDNENNAGTFTTTTMALNYLVAANGRVTIAGGTTPPVLYLYGQNEGFLVGTDPNVQFGILESQAAGPFSNTSLSGAFTFGTENPSAASVSLESGIATLDGTGNAAGTSDQSNSAGLTQNQSLSLTYSVTSNGAGTFGSGTKAILVSGNKLVFISKASTTPTIAVVEK